MPTKEQFGAFDEITEIGGKYNLTTARFMEFVQKKNAGERISPEAIARELIGSDYELMDEGRRNLIFTTLIKPDLEQAAELGILAKVPNGNEYERSDSSF